MANKKMATGEKKAGWTPARYEMGLTRTVRPAVAKFSPSQKTMNAVGTVTDFLVGGVLAGAVFMTVSPRCLMPGNPSLGDHPEAALLTSLVVSGAFWFFTGQNYTTIASLAATLGIYGACKILK